MADRQSLQSLPGGRNRRVPRIHDADLVHGFPRVLRPGSRLHPPGEQMHDSRRRRCGRTSPGWTVESRSHAHPRRVDGRGGSVERWQEDRRRCPAKVPGGIRGLRARELPQAEALADVCLESCATDSYWYAGALGLKCWIALFTDDPTLSSTAEALLGLDSGDDKPWFDGMALLNLALASRRRGRTRRSRRLFLLAAERYGEQSLRQGQPPEWRHVIDYFGTLCRWAAGGDRSGWERLIGRLEEDPNREDGLLRNLGTCVRLMLRSASGEEVLHDAEESVKKGVSRTFLSLLLLERPG